MPDAGKLRRAIKMALDEKDPNPPDWAQTAWLKAKAKGLTDGSEPNRPATRAEVMVILDRAGVIDKMGGE